MAILGKKSPIYWCGQKNQTKGLSKKGISPSGTVARVPLSTGKTITSYIGNTYAQVIELEKESRRWVWYDECPKDCDPAKALEFRTEKDDASFCETCAARETLIRTRTSAKGMKNSEYAKMFENNLDRLTQALEAQQVNNQRPVVSDEALLAAMDGRTKPDSKKAATK